LPAEFHAIEPGQDNFGQDQVRAERQSHFQTGVSVVGQVQLETGGFKAFFGEFGGSSVTVD
jgi:hypothetical protein